MKHSESIQKLGASLARVQATVEHAHKNATNPHFRNRYADLTEVLDTIRPALAAEQIAIVQFPGYADGVATVETVLVHSSGEWMAGTAGARVQKDDPQGVGSAITYLRRYSLAAVCGIAQEDDDGEGASNGRSVSEARPTPAKRSSEPVGVQHTNAPDIRDQALAFGKHKGKTWGWLLEHHPDYVEWALENMERLAPEAKDYLRLALSERKLAPVGAPVDDRPLSEPEPDTLPF